MGTITISRAEYDAKEAQIKVMLSFHSSKAAFSPYFRNRIIDRYSGVPTRMCPLKNAG